MPDVDLGAVLAFCGALIAVVFTLCFCAFMVVVLVQAVKAKK